MDDNKSSDLRFDTDSMMECARSLQVVCEELDKRKIEKMKTDTSLFSGTLQTVPIIMSLAIEIALKAWLIREQEKNSFPHIHDLVELFDRLKPTTKETLEVRMRNLSPDSIWADQPSMINLDPDFQETLGATMDPLRKVLDAHRNAHMHFRHLYEKEGISFDKSEMDKALTVIIDAYCEKRGALTKS